MFFLGFVQPDLHHWLRTMGLISWDLTRFMGISWYLFGLFRGIPRNMIYIGDAVGVISITIMGLEL